jgi:Domain of unknown function (DUF4158)
VQNGEALSPDWSTMKKHEILSPQSRAALFDPPLDVASIVRHYTFSTEDLALIRQKRRDANRLGFAVHLAYLRYPGRVLSPSEMPPKDMLAFIANQLLVNPSAFLDYGQREATRWEHLNELYTYLGLRPFRHDDEPTIMRIAREGHRQLNEVRQTRLSLSVQSEVHGDTGHLTPDLKGPSTGKAMIRGIGLCRTEEVCHLIMHGEKALGLPG